MDEIEIRNGMGELIDILMGPVKDPSSAAAIAPLIVPTGTVWRPIAPRTVPPGAILTIPSGLTLDASVTVAGTGPLRQAARAHEWLTCCPRCSAVTTLDGDGRERCLLCPPVRPDPTMKSEYVLGGLREGGPSSAWIVTALAMIAVAVAVAGGYMNSVPVAAAGFAGFVVLMFLGPLRFR